MGIYSNHVRRFKSKRAAAMLHVFSPVLSDEHCKEIIGDDLQDVAAAIIEHGPPYSVHEVITLVKAAGMKEDFDESEETLAKYAENIRNYKYQYKDEAKTVDPSIDTNTEHIGPMAQDIEKVNPAAVVADPKTGYKTVDTGRLALMNAGAIADLAREVQELKNGSNR